MNRHPNIAGLLWIALLIFLVNLLPVKKSAGQSWQPATALPEPIRGSTAVVYENNIWVMGGQTASNKHSSKVFIYNPSNGNWTTGPTLRKARTRATAAVFNNKIYLIGGQDSTGSTLKDVEEFDPGENRWRSFTDLEVRREGAMTVILDNEMYVLGGSDDNETILPSTEYYDEDDDQWELSDDWSLDVARASFSTVVFGGSAYSFGGFSTTGPIGLVQQYDLDGGTQNLASMPQARGSLCAAARGGQVYVAGGRTSSNTTTARVDIFAPDQNAWSRGQDLINAREEFSCVSFNDQVFVIGGKNNNGNAMASVEVFKEGNAVIAINDTFTLNEDESLSLNVLLNDSDPDGQTLGIRSFTQPANGTVSIMNNTQLLYEPDPHFFGTDQFFYEASNTSGSAAQAQVSLNVRAVNDAPAFTSTPVTSAVINALFEYVVQAEDVDNDPLTLAADGEVPDWLVINQTGATRWVLTGTPAAGTEGTVAINLVLDDGTVTASQSFAIEIVNGAPTSPMLLAPADESLDIGENTLFSWDATGATTYDFQLSLEAAFSTPLLEITGQTASELTTAISLEPLTRYYWRVRASNQAGASPWSGAFSFVTAANVASEPEKPANGFHLHPPYPNPFTHHTTIEVDLPGSLENELHVSIFDIQGRQVAQLGSAYIAPGRQQFSWDGTSDAGMEQPSGVYLCVLQWGDQRLTRLLTLVR